VFAVALFKFRLIQWLEPYGLSPIGKGVGAGMQAVSILVFNKGYQSVLSGNKGDQSVLKWTRPSSTPTSPPLLPPPSSVLSTLFILPGRTGIWVVTYSIFPVLGVTLLGAAFGHLFKRVGTTPDTAWRKLALPSSLAAVCLCLFVAMRTTDAWGSTNGVATQVLRGEEYWEALFKTTKYPFSVTAVLYALGFNLSLLSLCVALDRAACIRRDAALCRLPLELGGASLMGYVTHLWLITLTLLPLFFLLPRHSSQDDGHAAAGGLGPLGVFFAVFGVQFPLVLFGTFLVCERFGRFKRETAADSRLL